VAFLSLQDADDMPQAMAEARRVLGPGGGLVLAIVHPINSAGGFEGYRGAGQPFVVRAADFGRGPYTDDTARDGLRMRFSSEHRSLDAYSRALEDTGFVIEALREVTEPDPEDRWFRVPMFLHLRARLA